MPLDETPLTATPPVADETPVAKAPKKSKSTSVTKELKRQVELCKTERSDLIDEWTDSKGFHGGKPFAEDSDSARIAINKDWPRVKARVAQLFGQMPEIRLLPKRDEN